jgi:two-component system CheB/CheR fusion protein
LHCTFELPKDPPINPIPFFGDPAAFQALDVAVASVAASLSGPENKLRAWVAGCATGEEAYSVAILLSERAALLEPAPALQVFATDFDERAIAIARAGVYPGGIGADVDDGRLHQFFQKRDSRWAVRQTLRESVLFAAHDLMRDPPFSHLALICCRHLLLGLARAEQRQMLQMFHAALQGGGLLFIGSAALAEAAEPLFAPLDAEHGVYRARPVRRRPRTLAAPGARVGGDAADAVDAASEGDSLRALLEERVQSLKEELATVNQALKLKVDEASQIHDDLKNLIASTDVGTVFVDRSARIKRFTPPAAHLLNLSAAHIGRSLFDIPHRLDYPELAEDVGDAFYSLRIVEREVKGPRGTTFLVRALPYRTHEDVIDGAVLNFVDISAARRAEEKLREGEARMRMIVESTKDYAIIATSPQGIVTSWNVGAERLFGYTEAEMKGELLARIYTDEDRAAGVPAQEMRRALEDGRATDERWARRKDGSVFYCSGIMTPMVEAGLIGYAKIARDLTDSKRTEAQLEALLIKEKETRAELQAASAMKDDFLAVMSHELKHPLNLIHVNAELLSRLPEVRGTAAATRAADVIRRTVMNQAKIIDDLLDLSRMQTGKMSLDIRPIDWSAIVSRVMEAVTNDAQHLNLDLASELDAAAAYVHADPVRVEQMVWNLVSNALKFTPRNGAIQARISVEGGEARLDVIDTGQGIAAELLPHVFDLFWQAERGTTRSRGGMGIGLALVKHLAEEHHGRVAVASEGPGLGAKFSVWLPRAHVPQQAFADARHASPLSGLRMLLVDDTLDALESFAALLQLEGAEVTTASSAQQALDAAERTAFDIVVSDVAMPVMDGYELIARLRSQPAYSNLPAIALTGFGRPQDERRAIDAGFDAHLTKPASIETLVDLVHRLRRTPGTGGDGVSQQA